MRFHLPENCERLKEYAFDMNVSLNEALNEALSYFFATVGAAKREHRAIEAAQLLNEMFSKMGQA